MSKHPTDREDRGADQLLDEIDANAAAHLLRWAGEAGASSRTIARPTTFRRRVRLMRTAFAGDIRMSFIVFLALLFSAGTGWLVAHFWYGQAHAKDLETVRAKAYADGNRQVLLFMSRVQDTPEANEELIKAVQVLYKALQNTGYDPEKIGQLQ